MNHLPDLSVQLLSRTDLLAPVRCMVVSFAERLGFDERMSGHIALALDEALANVIRHGYGGRNDCRIWISLWELRQPAGLRIVVDDLARQVEPELIRGRNLSDLRPGGLGVHLMRSTMDVVRYEKRPEGGMRLILEKTLEGSVMEPAA